MGQLILKPELAKDCSAKIQESAIKCEAVFDEIKTIIKRLEPENGLWQGPDAKKFIGAFNNFKSSFPTIKEILSERAKTLNGAVEQYVELDKKLNQEVVQNPANIDIIPNNEESLPVIPVTKPNVPNELELIQPNTPESDTTGFFNKPKPRNRNRYNEEPKDVPSPPSSYKSYTKYTKVTKRKEPNGDYSTPQGAVVYGGKYNGVTYDTHTDEATGVRYVNLNGEKFFCAAMGTYFGDVGDIFSVTTDKGNTYKVIMCDVKGIDAQGWHNGKTWYHQSGGNKCVTEFYIDHVPEKMKVYRNGKYIGTTGTYDTVDQFKGNVISVNKLTLKENNPGGVYRMSSEESPVV